jgi:hypothetical protein
MAFNFFRLHTDGTAATNPTFRGWWADAEQPADCIIYIWAMNDGGGTSLSITESHASDPDLGWVELHGPAPSNSGTRTAFWYRRRKVSAISLPTITGASDEWCGHAELLTGIDSTTAIDVSAVTEQTSNTTTPTAPSVTTTTANCIVRYLCATDGGTGTNVTGPTMSQRFGSATLVTGAGDNPGSVTQTCGYVAAHSVQETAAATGTFRFAHGTNDGGRQMTVAFRKAGGAAVPAHMKTVGSQTDVLFPYPTSQITTATDISTLTASIEGITVQSGTSVSLGHTASIGSEQSLDEGFVGGWLNITSVQLATTGPAGYYGAFVTLAGGNVDFQNNLYMAFIRNTGSQQRVTDTPLSLFMDASGNWVFVRTASRLTYNNFNMHLCRLPDLTPVASSGTINWAQINRIGHAKYATANTGGTNRNQAIDIKYLLAPAPGAPLASFHGALTLETISEMLKSFGVGFPAARLQGGVQLLAKYSFQLGDGGTGPVSFNGEGASIAFPSDTNGYVAEDLDNVIKLNLGASDNISLTALSIVSQDVDVDFHFEATSNTAGLTGSSAILIGQDLDLQNSQDITGATVISANKALCYGSTLDGCTIKTTKSSDAAANWTANGGGFTNGTIDLTGVTCNYHVELGVSVTDFDLTDSTLSGTPTVNNIHVLRTTGTVTITLALGQSVPTYTSAGATVVFDQPVLSTTWENPDLADGTTILVRNITASTTIAYVASLATGTGYTITLVPDVDYTVGDEVQVRQSRKNGTTYYEERTSRIITSAGGGTITEADQLAVNTICTAFGLDGSTFETKFSLDSVNDELDIDVSGNWKTEELMVYFKFKMTQQAPMEEFWGAWTVETDGSFLNDTSVLPGKLDNTSSGDAIETTRRRIHRTDGARPVRSPTTSSYTVDVSWSDPVTVVATGSGVLPADIIAIGDEVATRSQAGDLHADVRWVNNVDVTGTGQVGDEWGPA